MLRKYSLLLIEIFLPEEFDEVLFDEWGDNKDFFLFCKFSLSYVKNKVSLIEKGQSTVYIISYFHDCLISIKHNDCISDAEAFQRYIYTVFDPVPYV